MYPIEILLDPEVIPEPAAYQSATSLLPVVFPYSELYPKAVLLLDVAKFPYKELYQKAVLLVESHDFI